MPPETPLRLPDTAFMRAVATIIRRIDGTIAASFQGTIDAFFVGGVAVHVYTRHRVSADLDAVFSRRPARRGGTGAAVQ